MVEMAVKGKQIKINQDRPLQRWVLMLAYDGSAFHGWQKQPRGLYTIQSVLEKALSQIANEPINVIVAGRTDAGVHATGQIVHFDTSAQRSAEAWLRGANTAMDKNVRILQAQLVSADFHARFDAYGRRYRYMLESSQVRMPQLRGKVGWTHYALDIVLMREAAKMLIGEHDFSSFRSSDCQAKSPVKKLYDLCIAGSHQLMAFDFHGSAFVHNMVRNIIGALVYVGAGKMSLDDFERLLASKSRRLAPPTFMPDGLYLVGVDYPEKWHVATAALPQWLWPHLI